MGDDFLTEEQFRALSIDEARDYAEPFGVKGRGLDDLVEGLQEVGGLITQEEAATAAGSPEPPPDPEPAGGADAVAEDAISEDEEPERAKAIAALAKAQKAVDDARGEARKATDKLRDLEENLGQLRDKAFPDGTGSDDFYTAHKRYLRTQAKHKETLVAKRREQAERLAGAAPIDKAMSRKNTRGEKRPAVPSKK